MDVWGNENLVREKIKYKILMWGVGISERYEDQEGGQGGWGRDNELEWQEKKFKRLRLEKRVVKDFVGQVRDFEFLFW